MDDPQSLLVFSGYVTVLPSISVILVDRLLLQRADAAELPFDGGRVLLPSCAEREATRKTSIGSYLRPHYHRKSCSRFVPKPTVLYRSLS
jgi:hypothetical protein